jgi:hypothetical protein
MALCKLQGHENEHGYSDNENNTYDPEQKQTNKTYIPATIKTN